jgi:phosphoglycolate phosphatase
VQGYDAVVYDLDGTLVTLDVDWDAAARDVDQVLQQEGVEADAESLWELLDIAVEAGLRDPVEAAIASHEEPGAHAATADPLAATLPHQVPVGVCSLNCESACRIALERFDLDPHVDVVAGRDSTPTYKPDPGALAAVLERLDVPAERAVFVGDSLSDRETATGAGVDFAWASEWAETIR